MASIVSIIGISLMAVIRYAANRLSCRMLYPVQTPESSSLKTECMSQASWFHNPVPHNSTSQIVRLNTHFFAKSQRFLTFVSWIFCPRSSVDRASASGAVCTGSTPVGGTKSLLILSYFSTYLSHLVCWFDSICPICEKIVSSISTQ